MDIEDHQAEVAGDSKGGERHGMVDSSVRVDIKESVGAAFLGIVAVLLLIALLRAEGRNRKLLAQMS